MRTEKEKADVAEGAVIVSGILSLGVGLILHHFVPDLGLCFGVVLVSWSTTFLFLGWYDDKSDVS